MADGAGGAGGWQAQLTSRRIARRVWSFASPEKTFKFGAGWTALWMRSIHLDQA